LRKPFARRSAGTVIAPRGSNTIGTLIGAAAGVSIGYAIEHGEVRCQ